MEEEIKLPKTWGERFISSGMTKIIFTIISISIIATLFILQFKRNLQTEPLPPVKTMADVIQGTPLTKITKEAILINTGIYLEDFPEFGVTREIFVADCLIWFEFEKDKVPLTILEQFAIEDGDIKQKSKPFIQSNN